MNLGMVLELGARSFELKELGAAGMEGAGRRRRGWQIVEAGRELEVSFPGQNGYNGSWLLFRGREFFFWRNQLKIIKQIAIIFLVCWVSLVIEHFLPFSFSASIIGMILLFLCLFTGVLKIEHIQEKSDFLLSNMAFFFIPAGVSIINYCDILKSNVWQILVICAVTTFVTFGVTALSIRLTMKLMNRKRAKGGKAKC